MANWINTHKGDLVNLSLCAGVYKKHSTENVSGKFSIIATSGDYKVTLWEGDSQEQQTDAFNKIILVCYSHKE